MKIVVTLLAGLLFTAAVVEAGNLDPKKPNVMILYFDDLGYGDVGVYQPTENQYSEKMGFLKRQQKSLTPNLDEFAAQGVKYNHAHSASGVCTPSRYALLTGEYAWRTGLKRGVTFGYSPTIMEPGTETIASMLKKQGYQTAMVGKWHIGMQFYDFDGKPVNNVKRQKTILSDRLIDFSKPLTDTPYHAGFDYYFGTTASLDMPPYAWVESNSKTNKVHMLSRGAITSGDNVDFDQARIVKNSDLIEGPVKGVRTRPGIQDPSFVLADYMEVQAAKVKELMAKYEKSDKPFFIYVPVPAPHTPHVIQPQFEGLTGFEYGDYLVQSDYYAGQIIGALGDPNDPSSLASNTLVLVTSDNGPEVVAQRTSLAEDHDPNGPFKGIKRDNWEGGTRVPFMVRWPNKITPRETNQLVWQGDFMATVADYVESPYLQDIPDAKSFLANLVGRSNDKRKRPGIIEHSSGGQFAIVEPNGVWKLVDGRYAGSLRYSWDYRNQYFEMPKGKQPKIQQLYNLALDPGETNNLLVDDPENPYDDHEPTQTALMWAEKLNQGLLQIRGADRKGEKGTSF